ncbi:MAG: DegV family protein [Oscillospiraceae bacterium]|jgi:DegV family protein with EDD domain|nr:DegV family protein [Oscillospiraceae bacterium]
MIIVLSKNQNHCCISRIIEFELNSGGIFLPPDYVIFTESTAGFSKKQISKLNIEVLPLKFTLSNKTYFNDLGKKDLQSEVFFNLLRKGEMPVTSQINFTEFVEEFEKVLKQGKDILYVGFSSALSGTYASGMAAKAELEKKYSDRKILAVDTLAGSSGESLAVFYVVQNKKNGMSLEENASSLEKMKVNICHWIVLDSLIYAKRGGRLSSSSAFLGTLLGIRPILHVSNEGKVVPVQKARGKKSAIDKLIEIMRKNIKPLFGQTIFIAHADAKDSAEYLAKSIKKNFNVERILIENMDAVIGSHAGPGAVGVSFWGKER